MHVRSEPRSPTRLDLLPVSWLPYRACLLGAPWPGFTFFLDLFVSHSLATVLPGPVRFPRRFTNYWTEERAYGSKK